MSCRVIVLTFGYVESSSTSWVIFSTEDGHSVVSRKDALHSLVVYLYDKFNKENAQDKETRDKYKIHMGKCCQKAWNVSGKDLDHCPICGASYSVKAEETFSVDDWTEFLNRLLHSDADSYGEHDWPDNPERWSPWGYNFDAPANEVLMVQEHAAEILTMALAEIHPELKDILAEGQTEEWPDLSDNDYYLVREYHKMLSEEV